MVRQPSLQLKQIRLLQQRIITDMSQLAWQGTLTLTASYEVLQRALQQLVQGIEESLDRQHLTAGQLSRGSLKIYTWLKFLSVPEQLTLHLQATQTLHQLVASELASAVKFSSRCRTPRMGLVNLSGLYQYRQPTPTATAQLYLSQGFMVAEADILRAIAQTCLWGKNAQTSRIIRNFSLSEDYRQVLLALEDQAAPTDRPEGKTYHLHQVFERVNREYFMGQQNRPRLTWSRRPTVRQLGHYEPARDRIVISSALDQEQVPLYVVEFVMYHELLHQCHRETWVNNRLMVHTPQFRQQEAQFREYDAVQTWLRQR